MINNTVEGTNGLMKIPLYLNDSKGLLIGIIAFFLFIIIVKKMKGGKEK